MSEEKRIPINIWDDYWGDEHVPKGEQQETCIYVEDSNITDEMKKSILEKLLTYINNNIDLPGVKMYIIKVPQKPKIQVEKMTHSQRELLLEKLLSSELEYNGIPFNIYSES